MNVLSYLDGWKKIIFTVLLIIVGAFGDNMGLEPEEIDKIIKGIMVYLPSQGFADLGKYIAKYLNKDKQPIIENLGALDPQKYKV